MCAAVTTVATLLGRAIAAHQAGDVERAARMYRDVLAVEPGHAQASHLLGFALLQLGAPAEAVPLLSAALRRSPRTPEAWAHLGLALGAIGLESRAAVALRRSLLLAPALLDAAIGIIKAARDAGRAVPERAAARVVVVAPLRAVGWHSLGLARAVRGADTSASDDGVACLRRAALIDPADRPAVADLADALRNRRDPESARRVGRWATRLSPASSPVRSTLAATLFDLDRIAEADLAARAAAVLVPGNAKAYGNRAQCLYRVGRSGDALVDGRRAAMTDPIDPQIGANLASYHLAVGDLREGWRLFRCRPARQVLARRPELPEALWQGERGARLLVLAEQGLGDELLFATCWPDLAAHVRAGRLAAALVEVDDRLRPLAERTYPELQWFDRDRGAGLAGRAPDCPAFVATHWIAAGDLPSLFRRRVRDFPQEPGYLVADAGRVEVFRNWLDEVAPGRPRFGFCWRSGLRTGDRMKHYPALAQCGPLLRLPGLRLVVLQYDDCAEEIADVLEPANAPLLVPPGLDRHDDLDGVAALIAALDGVVSAETAVLALAGALGAPSIGFGLSAGWVALGQPRSPWCPSLTSIHRGPEESWDEVMSRVARKAAERVVESKEPGGKATRLD